MVGSRKPTAAPSTHCAGVHRQRHVVQVFTIGMTMHTGTVLAVHDWGEPVQIMPVVPSAVGSYERMMHTTGGRNASHTSDLLHGPAQPDTHDVRASEVKNVGQERAARLKPASQWSAV